MKPIFLHVVRLQYAFEYLRGILNRLRVFDGIITMLYVCSSLQHYSDFRKKFEETRENVLSLSRVPSNKLAEECCSILSHHTKCAVFLGYLEPGWMLEPTHQTQLRKLFRKFDVGMVCHFPESLPHSWKTEIHTFYTGRPVNQNGNASSVNDGCSVQDQSNI